MASTRYGVSTCLSIELDLDSINLPTDPKGVYICSRQSIQTYQTLRHAAAAAVGTGSRLLLSCSDLLCGRLALVDVLGGRQDSGPVLEHGVRDALAVTEGDEICRTQYNTRSLSNHINK